MDENGHVIAYGQVERNRSKVALNSPEEYHKLAKSFYYNAVEFYELCKAAAPVLYPASMAMHTNACLACELFLKSLLLAEEYNFYSMKSPEKKHNLFDLFSHLSVDAQNCIKNSSYLKNVDCFELELKSIGNGFEVIRYIAECRGMMVNVYFLYKLMCSLANISKYVVEQL